MSVKRIENVNDVVKRLLGEIEPQGETNTDHVRLENLKQTIELVDELISDIILVARHKNRHEHSMSLAGKTADDFISAIREITDLP